MASKEVSLRDRAAMLSTALEGTARRLDDVTKQLLALEEHLELEPAKGLLRTYVQMIQSEIRQLRG